MFTVVDVSQAFNVSKQTARYWAAEFAQHLDPGATPAKNKPRQFTEGDMSVFALVAQLREENASYADIHAALSAGERGEMPEPGQGQPGPEQAPAGAALAPIALIEQFAARIDQQYRGQIAAVEEERDHLRSQLQTERQERIEAEKRATAAETELRVLREREAQETSKETGQAGQVEHRPGLLGRLFGR